ncbi:MAG: DUF2117 domain-containing protein, partial [Methanomassiliicoccales archaeon]|nr:DUF2117 domain-containing protein [Methanomassiliicoccales archaeon]
EETIATDSRELPSVAIKQAMARSDLVVLVNMGKDRVSSVSFGKLVMSKVLPSTIPIVQIDDGLSIVWSGDDVSLSWSKCLLIGEVLDLRSSAAVPNINVRRLSGVRRGEHVWINGNVIGRVTADEVTLSQAPNGELQAEGLMMKSTGVERLGLFDLGTAIVRSGQVRRTSSKARSLISKKDKVCLIDHRAEESVFRCRDAAYVVVVGDDTSKISSALLFRLGVPVIAITDGDEDGISNEELFYPGSYHFRLEPGNDDLVGAMVRGECFQEGERISCSKKIEEMAAIVRAACAKKLLWERRY